MPSRRPVLSAAPTRRRERRLLLPLLVIIGAVLLIVLAIAAQGGSQSAEEGLGGDAGEIVEGETEGPDLTEFERRDPADPLAAGPVDAPVGLIVFSDYQCRFCAQWNLQTLPAMMELADAGELRIEWRDINVFGEASERAARASHAAAKQGQFWEYHELLFANGERRSDAGLTDQGLTELAASLGLDTAQFTTDMNSAETAAEVARNAELGINLGATSTPVFLLGGQPISGAQPTEVFLEAYETARAAAKS
ncbi:thioredoxin domain-containing protein [Leucobacter sp. cx-87]|nr:thioredoxin domain-containing protein [Leucobacter sp. cx-87]